MHLLRLLDSPPLAFCVTRPPLQDGARFAEVVSATWKKIVFKRSCCYKKVILQVACVMNSARRFGDTFLEVCLFSLPVSMPVFLPTKKRSLLVYCKGRKFERGKKRKEN